MQVRITPPQTPSPRRQAASRRIPAALAALVLVALLAAPAAAVTRPTSYYLAPGGADTASGSISHPWRSIYASLRKLRPGDTLWVRGGSYSFSGVHYTSLAGTSTKRILISAYPGETPVFSGTSTPAAFLYFDGNASWITVRGLTVQGGGATSYGSSLLGFTDNAHNIRIEKMRLKGSARWTQNQHLAYVASNSVNDIVFKWNTFDGGGCACAGLLQLYHDPNAAWVRVYGNTFRNADQAIMIWASVTGLKIWENHFASVRIAVRHHNSGGTTVMDNTGTSVGIGIYADSRRHLTVSGNHW